MRPARFGRSSIFPQCGALTIAASLARFRRPGRYTRMRRPLSPLGNSSPASIVALPNSPALRLIAGVLLSASGWGLPCRIGPPRSFSRSERARPACLRQAGFEIYVPRLREPRTAHGRKVVRTPLLFPGYLFVLIELQWHAARWAPGVTRSSSPAGRPRRSLRTYRRPQGPRNRRPDRSAQAAEIPHRRSPAGSDMAPSPGMSVCMPG